MGVLGRFVGRFAHCDIEVIEFTNGFRHPVVRRLQFRHGVAKVSAASVPASSLPISRE